MTNTSRQRALATAERLLNTEDILAAVPASGFLHGLAGTALLHARLAAVDSVFAQAAVRHWAAAAQKPGPHREAAGIFSNLGGLAASLIIGSAYLPDPDSQRTVTARAVRWLAARAVDLAHDREEHLRDPRPTTVGEAAIASLSDRPADLWDVEGPTLCHGYAGVLQSAAASQGGAVDSAANAVTESFNPRLTFTFQHLHNGVASDEPGLLTGSAGIALALADHGQLSAPQVPARWDSLLLLS